MTQNEGENELKLTKITTSTTQFDESNANIATTITNNNAKNLEAAYDIDLIKKKNEKEENNMIYKVNDQPPWYLSLVFGFQHYLTMFGGTIAFPLLLAPKLCMTDSDPGRGYIISTTLFCSGLASLLQATFGVRLPIIQGATYTFLVPILAMLSLPKWQCPNDDQIIATRNHNITYPFFVTDEERQEVWQIRIREIQGAIILASMVEMAIGVTGLVGLLLRWITPLAIVPTITLIGLTLFQEAADSAGQSWIVSGITILMMTIFSQYMIKQYVFLPTFNKKEGLNVTKVRIFKMFPVLLTIGIMWSTCAILTMTESISKEHVARTDSKWELVKNSPWIRIPLPFQFGWPTFSVYAFCGLIAGILTSVVESVGDYYACARLAGARPPPTHAINRGIWIEGLSCVLSGVWGSGGALTSYSENIGAIGVTRVGSRRVVQCAGLLIIVISLFVKFSMLFATMPTPIVGGVFCLMFAMISATGLSSLQFIDLNSSRNIFILGFSLFMGLCVPKWLEQHPHAINSGNEPVDQIITLLLRTGMFVGGFLGFVLDNTIPGTDEERGVKKWLSHQQPKENNQINDNDNCCYDLPFGLGNTLKKISFARFIPISSTYDEALLFDKIRSLVKKN